MPAINSCGVSYADEPLGWARDDYVQAIPDFDCYGNEIPRRAWAYASTVFTLPPYTRSMKITVRCYDDKISDTRLSIIAADEHKHVAEEAMRKDIARRVNAILQTPAGQQAQITELMTSTGFDIDLQDPVTGLNTRWSLLQWSAYNTRAYPMGRSTPEQRKGLHKELHRDWQRDTGWEVSGRPEEKKKKRLKLHAGLDLVEVNTIVEEEAVEVTSVVGKKTMEVDTEEMKYRRGIEDHELDEIYKRLLNEVNKIEGTKSPSGNKLRFTL